MTNMQNIKQVSDTVRLIASPEREDYESVYGKIDEPEYRKAIYDQIERDGMWHVTAQAKCPCCGAWIGTGSIGMIIGNPFSESDNCYLPDLIQSAEDEIHELENEFSNR